VDHLVGDERWQHRAANTGTISLESRDYPISAEAEYQASNRYASRFGRRV
jgi:hypothetical protein